MHLLFHLKFYNDVDHLTPVMWKFLENKAKVSIIFMHSKFDYKNDYRIKFLNKYKNFTNLEEERGIKKIRIFFLKIRHFIFSNRFEKKIRTYSLGRLILEFIEKKVWSSKWLKDNGITTVIYDWGSPARLNQRDAKWNNIPIIILPHGLSTINNPKEKYDQNYQMISLRKKGIITPNFEVRNNFVDKYIVQQNWMKEHIIYWGMKAELVESWGSTRYCCSWYDINYQISGNFVTAKESNSKFKILFLLQNFKLLVNDDEVYILLEKLSSLDFIHLVIKGHTRENILDEKRMKIFNKISESPNVEFNSQDNTTSIIKWSDLVINFASSVIFEAINQGKPIIHTPYLHRNKTIFDNCNAFHIAINDNQVIKFINKIYKNEIIEPDLIAKSTLLEKELYSGKKKYDVTQFYFDNIIKLSNK